VIVGHVSSGAYGHTLGACIGLGYVHTERGVRPDEVLDGDYAIEVAGKRVAADVSLKPMFDPQNKKIRC
jgi:4-methylaminobutanoate oxidase (formaldehyde-forming)